MIETKKAMITETMESEINCVAAVIICVLNVYTSVRGPDVSFSLRELFQEYLICYSVCLMFYETSLLVINRRHDFWTMYICLPPLAECSKTLNGKSA